MQIAVIPNLTRENAAAVATEVCQRLVDLGALCVLEDCCDLPFAEAKRMPFDQMVASCDAVIAVGGDGTIIHAAKHAAQHHKSLLGVNAGRLAFMAGVERHELHMLEALVKGEYELEKRMMLEAKILKDGEELYSVVCLNDAVVSRRGNARLVEIPVYCDDALVNHYLADGVIFATPTGSTAYSLSAGGPVLEPQVEGILFTPVCTHSLFSRSMLFLNHRAFSIPVEDGGLSLTCDGENAVPIPAGATVTIQKAPLYAEFIRIKQDNFIDVLNSKLAQRRI